jgi:hypothetical protein
VLPVSPSVQSPEAWGNRAKLGSKLFPLTTAESDASLTTADLDTRYDGEGTVNARRFKVSGDGVTDDTVKIQSMMDVAGAIRGRVHFPANPIYSETVYRCGAVLVPSYVTVTADDGVVFEKVDTGLGATEWTSHTFECIGVLDTGNAEALTVNATRNAASVTVADTSAFSVGQLVKLQTNEFKFSASGRNQETNVIVDITAGVITLRNRIIRDYLTAASAEIVPFSTESRNQVFRNIHVRVPSTQDGGGFYCENTYRVKFFDCDVEGAKGQASYQMWRAAYTVGMRSNASDGQSPSTPGYGYGVSIAEASHNCEWTDSKFSNVRENAISLNSKHCGYNNCESVNSYDNGFNTHGDGSEDCWFTDCRAMYGRSKGFSVAFTNAVDKRIRFDNCKAFYCGYIGFFLLGDSVGGNHEDVWIVDCEVRDSGTITASSAGIFIERCTRTRVINPQVHDLGGNNNCFLFLSTSTDIVVRGGELRQLTSNFAVRYSAVTGLEISDVKIADHGANESFHTQGTASTGVRIKACTVDQDIIPALTGTNVIQDIKYPTIREVSRGVASVADAATISHGLGQTPTGVVITTATADRLIAANNFGATTFRVNINVRSTGLADAVANAISWIAWK